MSTKLLKSDFWTHSQKSHSIYILALL